jgi:pimeloyl-ACP methyl ester carboxylesterase
MTARLLRIIMLVQLAAAALLGWAAWQRGLPWWGALALGVAAVFAVRFVITVNNFFLSWLYGVRPPPGRRLGPLAYLAMVLDEFSSTMLQSSWLMLRPRALQNLAGGAALPPVLLVHGYGCNRGYWSQLAERFDRLGIRYRGIDLEPMFGSIDEFVPLVAQAVKDLCRDAGSQQVILVAHSMGGLVARAYMHVHGAAALARVITLGTPHQGTHLASFGPGRNAAQMRPGSAWLLALAAAEDSARRAAITSIYTLHDNIVAPQDSPALAGARLVALAGVGHVAMGRHHEVQALLLQEIASTPPQSAGP